MEIKRLTKEELQDFTRLQGCKIENLYYRADCSAQINLAGSQKRTG